MNPFEKLFREAVSGAFRDEPDLLKGEERLRAWLPALAEVVKHEAFAIDSMRLAVRSPIEELFLAHLWSASDDRKRLVVNDQVVHEAGLESWLTITIRPQVPVGAYVADFVVSSSENDRQTKPWSTRVAVEIDGHDFHEKTKEQAAHDKRRDRFFTSQGLPFLRFTGSELVKAPAKCAREVIALLDDAWTKAMGL
jgi:very-short-patch-repair endonuclease